MRSKAVVLVCFGFLLLSSLACNGSGGGTPIPPTATPLPTREDWQLWADQNRPRVPTIVVEIPLEWASTQVPYTLRSSGELTELYVNGSKATTTGSSLTGTLKLSEGLNTIFVRTVSTACPEDVHLREFGCVNSEATFEQEVLVDTQPPSLDYQTASAGGKFKVWGEVRDAHVGPDELSFIYGFEVGRVDVSQGNFSFLVSYEGLGDFLEVRVYDRLGNEAVYRVMVVWPARWVLYDAEGHQITYRLNQDFHPFSLKDAGFKALSGWGAGTHWVLYDDSGNVVETMPGTNDTVLLVTGGLVVGLVIFGLAYMLRVFFLPLGKVFGQMSQALEQAQKEFEECQSGVGRVQQALPKIEVEDIEPIFVDLYDRPPRNNGELAEFIEENNPFIRSRLRRR